MTKKTKDSHTLCLQRSQRAHVSAAVLVLLTAGLVPSLPVCVMAASKEMICKQCGLSYTDDQGRVHGSVFTCGQCQNVLQTIRRNLGSTTDLQEWSVQETHSFFQTLKKQKQQSDGKLQWSTVRASLIKRMTEKQIQAFTAQVQVEELPLSVWEKRGWDKATVLRFPSQESQEYGCLVYALPVKKLTWAETFQQVEEKILEKEKQAQGKKKAEGLDVPLATGVDEKQNPRKAAAQEKKTQKSNEKIASVAAKCLGCFSSLENSLKALIRKTDGVQGIEEEALKLRKENLETTQTWAEAARKAVNDHQSNLQAGATGVALTALPFSLDMTKTLQKQACEAQKVLRSSIPKKEAKSKAKATAAKPAAKAGAATKRKSEGAEGDGQEPSKRRTQKTPP